MNDVSSMKAIWKKHNKKDSDDNSLLKTMRKCYEDYQKWPEWKKEAFRIDKENLND